jgi:hypothetical protein
MSRTVTMITVALLVAGLAVGAILALRSRPGPGTARIKRLDEADRTAAFIAKFDSLTETRLYPTVWRSGTFLKTGFDEDREKWTLTVSSRDWHLRDDASKRNLGATLFSAFQALRAQAGGEPDPAILLVEDEEGEILLRASQETGVVIDD